jgi:hypothetical protein
MLPLFQGDKPLVHMGLVDMKQLRFMLAACQLLTWILSTRTQHLVVCDMMSTRFSKSWDGPARLSTALLPPRRHAAAQAPPGRPGAGPGGQCPGAGLHGHDGFFTRQTQCPSRPAWRPSRRPFDLGCTFFDTAEAYNAGKSSDNNEQMLGEGGAAGQLVCMHVAAACRLASCTAAVCAAGAPLLPPHIAAPLCRRGHCWAAA